MSDRLTLTNAITEALVSVAGQGTASVDARVIRAQAERVASVIFDAIHDNVATKADLDRLEHRLTLRGITALVTGLGALFAALHQWPPL